LVATGDYEFLAPNEPYHVLLQRRKLQGGEEVAVKFHRGVLAGEFRGLPNLKSLALMVVIQGRN
jgi:hypothetical protein